MVLVRTEVFVVTTEMTAAVLTAAGAGGWVVEGVFVITTGMLVLVTVGGGGARPW